MPFHAEVMQGAQQGLLRALGAFATESGFYLAGGTLHGTAGGVKLSFLEYRYPALVPLVEWPEFGCRLAGLEDIACMKLSAIASRGARKDFIDVYALGRSGFAIADMLAQYRSKFAVEDAGHVLMSLTYFDDAELEEMPELLWQIDWPEVRQTIESWVREFVNQRSAGVPPRDRKG